MKEEKERCHWCKGDPLYQAYHDQEWGVPIKDDRRLFEFLLLETFQAGLSWITILRKRPHFQEAFDQFDYRLIARYQQTRIDQLMANPGIIRNRGKILAAVKNAQAFMKVQEEFGSFARYIWRFVNNKPIQNSWREPHEIPALTPLSVEVSKDLKKRGFKFVGPTVVYAHMQATGMSNDHIEQCFRHKEIRELGKNFRLEESQT